MVCYAGTARLVSNETNEFGGARGILQALTDSNETWRYVDASTWTLKNAIVACTDLGEHDYICASEQDHMQMIPHWMWS